jgi:hypothetical protein
MLREGPCVPVVLPVGRCAPIGRVSRHAASASRGDCIRRLAVTHSSSCEQASGSNLALCLDKAQCEKGRIWIEEVIPQRAVESNRVRPSAGPAAKGLVSAALPAQRGDWPVLARMGSFLTGKVLRCAHPQPSLGPYPATPLPRRVPGLVSWLYPCSPLQPAPCPRTRTKFEYGSPPACAHEGEGGPVRRSSRIDTREGEDVTGTVGPSAPQSRRLGACKERGMIVL